MKTWQECKMKKKDIEVLWRRAADLGEKAIAMYPSRFRNIRDAEKTKLLLDYPEVIKEMIVELENMTTTNHTDFNGKYFRLCPHTFCN